MNICSSNISIYLFLWILYPWLEWTPSTSKTRLMPLGSVLRRHPPSASWQHLAPPKDISKMKSKSRWNQILRYIKYAWNSYWILFFNNLKSYLKSEIHQANWRMQNPQEIWVCCNSEGSKRSWLSVSPLLVQDHRRPKSRLRVLKQDEGGCRSWAGKMTCRNF